MALTSQSIRKRLLSTVLCGGVMIFSAALSLDAQAAPGQVFRPNSSWAISKIAANESGGTPYCALARRFSEEVILTIARNAGDESSFAIDFQKDILSKSQNYRVTLQPGVGQSRSFDVRPVSGRAMVIRLGKDYALYDALNRSGRLDVDVSGKSYSFDLADFREGQDLLNGCLAVMTEPAAGDSVSSAPYSRPVEDVVMPSAAPAPVMAAPIAAPVPVAQQQCAPADAGAFREIEFLRRENQSLKTTLDSQRRDFETTARQQSDSGRTVAQLNEKIRFLENENADIRHQLATVPTNNSGLMAQLNERIRFLETENQSLRQKTASMPLPQDPGQVAALNAKIRMLEDENTSIRHKLATMPPAANPAEAAQLSDRIRQLEVENEAVRRELAVAQQIPVTPPQTCSPGGAQVTEAMAGQVRSLRNENERLRQQIERLNVEMAEAGRRAVEADRKVADLSARMAGDRQAVERDKAAVVAQLQTRVEGLTAQNNELRKALDGISVGSANAQARIVALEAENMDLKRALDGTAMDKARADGRVTALETENIELRKALDSNFADNGQARARMAALEAENQHLRQSLDGLSGDSGRFQDRVAMLEAENINLKKALDVSSNGDAAVHARISMLEAENTTLKQTIDGLYAQSSDLKSQMAALQSENGTLKYSLETASAPAFDDSGLRDRVAMLESENASLRSSLANIQTAAGESSVSGADGGALAQLRIVEEKLQAVQAERDSLARQIETYGKGGEAVMPSIASADWDLEQATRRYNEAERELRRLGQQLEQARDQCASEKRQIEAMLFDPAIASQEQSSRLSSLERELVEKTAALERAQARVAALEPSSRGTVSASSVSLPVAMAAIQPAAGPAVSSSGYNQAAYKPDAVSKANVPAPAPAPVAASGGAASMPRLSDEKTVAAFLERAGIKADAGVKPIDPALVSGGMSAYTWEAQGLFGSIEQGVMKTPADFDRHVAAYLEKTKARCAGDFAASPGMDKSSGAIRAVSYEIACIGKEGSASAAILFFGGEGLFSTLAHEASVENMDEAMTMRDRIAAALLGDKLALK